MKSGRILGKKKINISSLLANATAAASVLASVVYIFWFAANLDKRVSLLEKNDHDYLDRLTDIRDTLDNENNTQDQQQNRFQDDVQNQLNHLDGKIEKIYTVLVQVKHQTV